MNSRGSTSAELEDPATATPSQEQPQDDSSSEAMQQDGEQQQEELNESTDKDTPQQNADPKSVDKLAKPAPDIDPVKAAIERLASDGPKPTDDKTKTPAKAEDGSGEQSPPSSEKTDSRESPSQGSESDPIFANWTPQERRHTKGAVKERFRELHATVQKMEPDAVVGKGWSEMIESRNLTPDIKSLDDEQLAWSIRAQGAAVRAVQAAASGLVPNKADLDTIDQLRLGLAEVDKAIGRRQPVSDPHSLVESFTGEIPEDLLEAAEQAGLSEKEARLIAAFRSHKPTPKTQQPAPVRQPEPEPRQLTRTVTNPPTGPDRQTQLTESYWARQTNDGVAKTFGIKPEQVAAHFQTHVTPVLAEILGQRFPGQPVLEVFKNLGPDLRHKLTMDAVAESHSRTRPTPPKQPQSTNRPPLRAGGGGGSPPAPIDPVHAAIARLRSD